MAAILRHNIAVGPFLGIRKNSDYQSDLGQIHPFHLIAVALVGVALFVGGLIALVHWIVP